MEPTQCGCMHRRARVHTDHGANPVWLHVTQATKANVPRKTMSALPCTRQQWMRETDGHQTWTSGGTVELCFPVNRNASRTPKLYTSVIWDTYRAKTWKESNSLSCTLGARCALEQLVECAPGKKRRRRTLCSVHREQLEQTLLTCNDTGHLTSTHPLPSRCTNISGAMYAGVPRGSVCTLPQPRPLARGMARSANPKSLILADMDTVPSGSSLVTHSTCE